MRLKLGALAIVSFCLFSAQHPAAGLPQEPVKNKDEVATSLPLTLRGIPSKQIMVGKQEKFLPDLALLDQDDHQVRFYSDLIKGRKVLISFFFTSCGSTCLRQGKVLSDLQKELGDRLGKDIFLISVTMDPETDTPQRLKTWGQQYGRKDGWTLVTGRTVEMEKLVGHLTGNPLGRLQTHAPFVYLGNDKTNHWIAPYGLSAKDLMKQIEEL
jgi:protein SCO1